MIQDRYTDPGNRYNRTAVIDETGRRWTFVYDERKNVVRSTGPDQVSRQYEWGDEYNQLRRVQIDGISGAWVYSYDERGNLTAAADPDERTRYYSGYGPLGLPRSVANGEGETTSLGYDQWGNLSVIDSPATGRTEMTYDAAGRLIAEKPTGERSTTYDWSPDSREVVVTDSAGETHLYRWDAAGNLVYYDQPGSGAHSWSYNPLGHLEFYTDATEAHYEWTVNLAGDVTAYNPPEAGVWEYTYHPNGQIRTETIPGRGIREYVYDLAGRIERAAGPEGTTNYHYDNAGRLDRVEEPGGIVSEYLEYDPRGFVRRMVGPENRVFQWNYNGSGLVASMVDAERRVEYVYDEAGRVKEKRDSVAGTVVYRRNSRGLLESVVYPDETVSFAYDAAGRLTVADDPDMRERFAYNEAGRLSAVTYEDIGKRILYGYDELGNLATMTTPEGEVVTYERDPAGRTERLSAPHGIGAVLDWDDRGRLTQLDYANGTAAHLTYDPDNLLKTYSWNGPTGTLLERSFAYYPDQRLKEMREAQYRWSYRYDEAGRLEEASYPRELTANIRSWQDGQFPPGHAIGYGAIYSGVPEATHPGQGRADDQGPPGLGDPGGEAWDREVTFPPLVEHETWDYDDAANIERRTRDGSWDQFEYEGLNRLVDAGSIDYEYTRAGEVREKRTPGGTTTLSWNSRGELIEARTADGVTVRYGYDAFGRMVSRVETTEERMTPRSTDRSAYLWHERTLLAEYDVSEGGEANPYKEYFHVAGRLIAVKMYGFHGRREPGPEGFLHTKGGVMYYHTDRLGSPIAITDRHGEPVARYAWDAYGRAMAGIFEPYNSVGFTGHLYDQATGLTYFGARWYDADTGKFLSRDPIQDGWNWYAYVGGDPVNFVDLWGLEATKGDGNDAESKGLIGRIADTVVRVRNKILEHGRMLATPDPAAQIRYRVNVVIGAADAVKPTGAESPPEAPPDDASQLGREAGEFIGKIINMAKEVIVPVVKQVLGGD